MMMNLFSIFDPSTNMKLSLNWLSILIIFMFFPYQFWFIPSRYHILTMIFIKFLFKEYKILISYSFSNLLIFIMILLFIFLNNFMGLFPFIFTATSHMSICFSMSFSLWLSLMIFSWLNFFNNSMAHLIPQNTPLILIPFMMIIEFISLIIRPLTLSIRLMINMITGHLLLTLINSSPLLFNYFFFTPILISQFLLFILEISISMIQAYIFSILLTLYMKEI